MANVIVTKKHKFVFDTLEVDLNPFEAQLPVERSRTTRIDERVVSDPLAGYACSSTVGDGDVTIEKDEGTGFWDKMRLMIRKEIREELRDGHDMVKFREAVQKNNHEAAKLREAMRRSNHEAAKLREAMQKSNHEAAELREVMQKSNHEAAKLREAMQKSNHEAAKLREAMQKSNHEAVKLRDEVVELRESYRLSTFLIDTRTILDAIVLKCKPNATSRDDRLRILLDSEEADKLLLEANVTGDDVLELYALIIPRAGQVAHSFNGNSFNGNEMRKALLALRQNPSLCASMELSPKVIRTIESLFLCLVGVQNLDEVLPTSLISAMYADWKRDLEDKCTVAVSTGTNILNNKRMREKVPSSDEV